MGGSDSRFATSGSMSMATDPAERSSGGAWQRQRARVPLRDARGERRAPSTTLRAVAVGKRRRRGKRGRRRNHGKWRCLNFRGRESITYGHCAGVRFHCALLLYVSVGSPLDCSDVSPRARAPGRPPVRARASWCAAPAAASARCRKGEATDMAFFFFPFDFFSPPLCVSRALGPNARSAPLLRARCQRRAMCVSLLCIACSISRRASPTVRPAVFSLAHVVPFFFRFFSPPPGPLCPGCDGQ